MYVLYRHLQILWGENYELQGYIPTEQIYPKLHGYQPLPPQLSCGKSKIRIWLTNSNTAGAWIDIATALSNVKESNSAFVNCHDFKAAIKQPSPHLRIFRVTRAWQRIASKWQKVVPVLLANHSVFLGEHDLSRASFRFAMPLVKLRGLVPIQDYMLHGLNCHLQHLLLFPQH